MNVREERFKLFASYVNIMAAGLFIAAVAIFLLGSVSLHAVGQIFLGMA